ncbi:MAG: hypothetical protein D6692_04870, partial [Planctomycetota bacterium]
PEPSRDERPQPTPPVARPELEAVASAPAAPTPTAVPEPTATPSPEPSPVATRPKPESKLSLDALLGVVAEAAEELADTEPQPAAETAIASRGDTRTETTNKTDSAPPAPATDPMLEAALASQQPDRPEEPAPAGPSFEVAQDGTITVEGVGVIPGAGTASRPYVLDWQVLRSVAREYNPKQGQDRVPEWVMQLNGKHVRVEGNTLLPVVAASTDELLVMQNPWDGCCVGIPPTPYDAIEVKLAKMTYMGNSPTGFGQVEGTFKVDPYIVQGWLLGLYVIEAASFESAAGMALPDL